MSSLIRILILICWCLTVVAVAEDKKLINNDLAWKEVAHVHETGN